MYNYTLSAIRCTLYCYDGAQVIAEYDSSDNLLRKFIYGPYIDEPIMMIVVDGETETPYYYHFDGLGSVAALSNNSGDIVERYSYDVYGEPTIKGPSDETRDTSDYNSPYMFTGRRYDPETGLYYYRLRYYSPEIGRFLQTDPIGYYYSMNLYEYCWNNPINWLDPYGLTPWGYITGKDDYAFSEGIDSYLNDVTQSLLGVGEWVIDVGVWLYDTVRHPIQTAKGIGHSIAHPIETAKGIAQGMSDKVSKLLGDDPRAAGRVIGQAAGEAAVIATTYKAAARIRAGREISVGKNF